MQGMQPRQPAGSRISCGPQISVHSWSLTFKAEHASSFRARVEAGSRCTENQLPMADAFAVQALSTFAAEVTTILPVGFCCNNLRCSNLEGWSEMGQVGGHEGAGFCGGCGEAVYCSKACQEQHWSEGHEEICCLIQGHKNSSEAEREEAASTALELFDQESSDVSVALMLLTAAAKKS